MNKYIIGLVSFVSLASLQSAMAETPTSSTQKPSSFSTTQVAEIEKVVGDYLKKNPEIITSSFQEAMAKQQQEAVQKMEKAVAENKAKIFNDSSTPVLGNAKGSEVVVVFMDPNCGFCKKFHGELDTLFKTNKNVKVLVKDIPIMGPASTMVVKALLAAKNQGKYQQLSQAVFSSDKRINKKMLLKMASSVGLDTKKLEADMKSKVIKTQIDNSLNLAKAIGINGTPTLIIGETQVVPGFLTADELNKRLKETTGKKS